eukprot:m.46999 g.46999  ORF g.46999 m.46999 type:complete len:62 (+) comp7302_c0_seq1:2283-2468(+)
MFAAVACILVEEAQIIATTSAITNVGVNLDFDIIFVDVLYLQIKKWLKKRENEIKDAALVS